MSKDISDISAEYKSKEECRTHLIAYAKSLATRAPQLVGEIQRSLKHLKPICDLASEDLSFANELGNDLRFQITGWLLLLENLNAALPAAKVADPEAL